MADARAVVICGLSTNPLVRGISGTEMRVVVPGDVAKTDRIDLERGTNKRS